MNIHTYVSKSVYVCIYIYICTVKDKIVHDIFYFLGYKKLKKYLQWKNIA